MAFVLLANRLPLYHQSKSLPSRLRELVPVTRGVRVPVRTAVRLSAALDANGTSAQLPTPSAHQTTDSALKPPGSGARARRRAAERARVEAHRARAGLMANSVVVEPETENSRVSTVTPDPRTLVYVTIARDIRARFKLTDRLARLKVYVRVSSFAKESALRGELREGVLALHPELVERGLLQTNSDFIVVIGRSKLEHEDDSGLQTALQRFEDNFGVPRNVFAELFLTNVPPPPPPLSQRRTTMRARAGEALKERSKLRMVSFYKFVHLPTPKNIADRLLSFWNDQGVLGRVYVASEGVNAQLAVPVPMWDDFIDAMAGTWLERSQTVIPDVLTGTFLNPDADVERSSAPFEKLHVKVRNKVLQDGFLEPLDWEQAGREVPPDEWHEMILEANAADKDAEDSPETRTPIVLDCRNNYESDVGRFEGSEPLGTTTFRESWEWLEKRLENEPRDRPIMTFCTGGIRCNKVNAYLEQKMGFENTGRLAGGIVSYARTLRSQGRLHESTFKGVNHVFDGRVGETITPDTLGKCLNCGVDCNVQTDCSNVRCPRPFSSRIFTQCPDCAVAYSGACSPECLGEVRASQKAQREQSAIPRHGSDSDPESTTASTRGRAMYEEVSALSPDRMHDVTYAETMNGAECELLQELRRVTEQQFPAKAHMLCDRLSGPLLAMLARLVGARTVLEVGTFTGYATLSLARALPADGHVISYECDESLASVARSFFDRDGSCGHKIELIVGDAHQGIQQLISEYRHRDVVEHARQHGTGNTSGFVDLVYLDGDKNYEQYYDVVIDDVLRVGGLLVVDNVLFRGQVSTQWAERKAAISNGTLAEPSSGEDDSGSDDVVLDSMLARKRLKSLENVRKIARKIDRFNRRVARDPRVENVMLPIGDGVTLIRRVS